MPFRKAGWRKALLPFIATFILGGCGDPNRSNGSSPDNEAQPVPTVPVPKQPERVPELEEVKPGRTGEQTYMFCQGCHALTGDDPQSMASKMKTAGPRFETPEAFIRYLRSPLPGMPPFSDALISDEEALALYEYLMKQVGPPVLPDSVSGNATRPLS